MTADLAWLRRTGCTLSAALLFVASGSSPADAFCRTTTCDSSKESCGPPAGSVCTIQGMPIAWPSLCVSYSLQKDGSPRIPFDTFKVVTERSNGTWTAADCGGGKGPTITLQEGATVTCDQPEYNQHAGNANIVMVRNDDWPYPNGSHTLALTTVTFNTQNAQIYDVDMEVNGVQVNVTASDDMIDYDLQSILTHEAGHFLGLAHSDDPTATMYASYQRGTIGLRSLEADDVEGICAVYGQERAVGGTCDATPRHGFKESCGDVPASGEGAGAGGGCAMREQGRGAGMGGWIASLAAVLVSAGAAGARRRRRDP